MSEFYVKVVKLPKFGKHPNADTLSITQIDGCPVIFRTTDFHAVGDWAVYTPIEAMVPVEHPAFAFLNGDNVVVPGTKKRVKAKKIRGIFSMGILQPISLFPEIVDPQEGFDVKDLLGIQKWEEPECFTMQDDGAKDPGILPVFDIESYRKYKPLLTTGEEIYVSEKLHGTQSRYVWHTLIDEFYVGSHRTFKKEKDTNLYWIIAKRYDLAEKLKKHPHLGLYGEIYGAKVQDLDYGKKELTFAAFDLFDRTKGKFLDYAEFKNVCVELDIPTVPVLYVGPYNPEIIEPLAEGKSTIASNIREGVVIKPVNERWDHRLGRVVMKLVGQGYLLRKDGTEKH
jgi:RNA ligase (TIGR02306 family)